MQGNTLTLSQNDPDKLGAHIHATTNIGKQAVDLGDVLGLHWSQTRRLGLLQHTHTQKKFKKKIQVSPTNQTQKYIIT